ncbi:MAG: trypsin-like peptidase domain-containing protein [Planctomycetes bacterium]|nr:trypsin-like peptidase domain-containing protein [Planctomycetota bacterium]
MKYLLLVNVLVSPLAFCLTLCAEPQVRPNFPPVTTASADKLLTPSQLYSKASPAVVQLVIKNSRDRRIGGGTGFVISVDASPKKLTDTEYFECQIVTCFHVIRAAAGIDVVFSDGTIGHASTVLAESPESDLALLMVSTAVPRKTVLSVSISRDCQVGDKVFVIGNPQGLSNSLSEGLISGLREFWKRRLWYQISAPISPGSSGGPVFSDKGDVVGVVTSYLNSGQSLNFAIASGQLNSLLIAKPKKERFVYEGRSNKGFDDA